MDKKKIVIFYGREIGKNILKLLNKDKNIEIVLRISTKKIKNLRKLNLNKNYKLSSIIKLINASTFSGFEKPYFLRNNKKYYLDYKTFIS